MARSVNKATLIGNVGTDPEIKNLNNGGKVANFRLATTENWTDKDSGERKDRTTWHNIVIYNDRLVDVVDQYVDKGDMLYLEGEISNREYEKDGETKYITEIVLQRFRGELNILTSKREKEERGGGGGGGSRDRGDDRGGSRGGRGDDDRSASRSNSRSGGSRDRDDDRGASRGGGRDRDEGGRSSGRGRGSDLDDDVPF